MKFISTWRDNNFMWPIVCEGLWRGAFACKCRGGKWFLWITETQRSSRIFWMGLCWSRMMLLYALCWGIISLERVFSCSIRYRHPCFLQQIVSHVGGWTAWWVDWKVRLKEGDLWAVTTMLWSKTLNSWSETFDFLFCPWTTHFDRKRPFDWHVEWPVLD